MAITTEQLPSQALLSEETLSTLCGLIADSLIEHSDTLSQIRNFADDDELLDLTESALVLFFSELDDEARCAGCAEPVEWDICCDHMEEIRTGSHNSFLHDYEDCRF